MNEKTKKQISVLYRIYFVGFIISIACFPFLRLYIIGSDTDRTTKFRIFNIEDLYDECYNKITHKLYGGH